MPPIKEVIETLEKIKTLHEKKNTDYSGDKGPFYNFEFCKQVSAQFGSDRDKVFATLVSVKLARLSVLLDPNKEPLNESIEDSFDDLITYALLWKANYLRDNRF